MSTVETRSAVLLVVDDDPFVLRLIPDALVAEGYEVETAKNGREALEKTGTGSYDIILSDLRMPELDGVAFSREPEGRQPGPPLRFIFVSGATEPPEYVNFLEEADVPVLSKPFRVEDLQRLVQRTLQDQW